MKLHLSDIYQSVSLILGAIGESSKTLPNSTNLTGMMKSSNIFFIISEGEYSDKNTVRLSLKVSVSSENRINDTSETSLNTLIDTVIDALHKKPVARCKSCDFSKFELFTPESGKWLATIEFDLTAKFANDDDDITIDEPLVKVINYNIATGMMP